MADSHFARELWRRLETLHAVTYFAPESLEAAQRIGINGFWRTYFGYRAAPLGACSPGVVTAAFFGFAPAMVARAIPSIWQLATPEEFLQARAAGAAAVLDRLALEELRTVVEDSWTQGVLTKAIGNGTSGNLPLFLANRDVPLPDDPVAAFWQQTSTLREHRGDGHVVTWTARGFGPVEVAVLFVAGGGTSREALQPNRGWTDDEWQGAVDGSVARGLLDTDGRITAAGRQLLDAVERDTDRLAEAPFLFLDDRERKRLLDALTPAALAVAGSGTIPASNPMGLPLPGNGYVTSPLPPSACWRRPIDPVRRIFGKCGHKIRSRPSHLGDNYTPQRKVTDMSTTTQVVVYQIAEDKVDEFLGIKDQLITVTEALPGLVTSATFRSNEQPNLFIDRMEWQSAEAAEAGSREFMELPLAGRFMALMDGPPTVAGVFTRIAGT